MISNNYIPEKINEYNAYLDGTKMIGVAASVTLPEVNMKTSTVSGVGVNGELDSPTIGQFESMEQEIQFNTLYSSAMDMLSPLSTVNLTLRASQQVYDKQGGYNFKGLRVVEIGRVKKGARLPSDSTRPRRRLFSSRSPSTMPSTSGAIG